MMLLFVKILTKKCTLKLVVENMTWVIKSSVAAAIFVKEARNLSV